MIENRALPKIKSYLLKLAVNTVALIAVVHMLPGLRISSWQDALNAALLLGLANTFLRPGLLMLTLPFNVLSLGIFTLFINGSLFYLVSELVPGFGIDNFWSAFWGGYVIELSQFHTKRIYHSAHQVLLLEQLPSER